MLANEKGGSQLALAADTGAGSGTGTGTGTGTDADAGQLSAAPTAGRSGSSAGGAPPSERPADANQAERPSRVARPTQKLVDAVQRQLKDTNGQAKETIERGVRFGGSQESATSPRLNFYPASQSRKNQAEENSFTKNLQRRIKEGNSLRSEHDERRHFLPRQPEANLAKQESLLSESELDERPQDRGAGKCPCLSSWSTCCCCSSWFSGARGGKQSTSKGEEEEEEEEDGEELVARSMSGRWRRFVLCPLVVVLIYCVAVYCLPFVDISPQVPKPLPNVPFNFNEGPLRPAAPSQFKVQYLFRGQLNAPESVALDSQGNAYLAVEGGFILFAHLNKSSPIKSQYWPASRAAPELIKIAELNGVKPVPRQQQQARSQRSSQSQESGSTWRRECPLDEQLYGSQLYSPSSKELLAAQSEQQQQQQQRLWSGPGSSTDTTHRLEFVSHVKVSRCSKPLGTRLSPDESSLYVVDTLSGLYKVHLKSAERVHSSQRLVTRLIDFRANNGRQTLPAVQLDSVSGPDGPLRVTRLMNVSLRAVDDLTIDFGAGTKNGDLIYFTLASQQWPAVAFVYDALEGRPSGLVARFDTGSQQLHVLEPTQLAKVRTAPDELAEFEPANGHQQQQVPAGRFGAPRMDENDVFDERPLHFPNGIQLMDDKQALLIVDTSNKRILKYYVRGPRRGTSDLWAHTPNYADNIRRGYDKADETYWVVGCGRAHQTSAGQPGQQERDLFAYLRAWPMAKKFTLKNIYFFGWFIEMLGQHLLMSGNVRDFGYELKTGSSLCQNGCVGMMILQFNRNGDLIRSIHSREFPNDLKYYSQANEIIDAQNQEHSLLLSSPSYNYVTKLILPTESYPSLSTYPPTEDR